MSPVLTSDFARAFASPFALLALSLSSLMAVERPASASRLPRENLLAYHTSSGVIAEARSKSDWERRKQEIVAGFHSVAGEFPVKARLPVPQMSVEAEVDCGSYVRRTVTYESEPGSRVPAYLLVPKTALASRQKHPAVLALHSTDMEYGHRVVAEQLRPQYRAYAHDLAERGFVVLAPAYPLMGSYHPDLKALGYHSGTLKAIWDNRRGLDLLESLPFVRRGSFGAIGHSLGGHNAIYTAVHEPRIKVVVSSCGFDSFVDYMDGKIDGWCSERYLPRLREYRDRLSDIPFDFHELLGALAPRRVWINAPLGDTNFKWRSVDEIVQAAAPVYTLFGKRENLTVEHPDCAHDFPEGSRERAYAVLAAELAGSPRRRDHVERGTVRSASGPHRAGSTRAEGGTVRSASGPHLRNPLPKVTVDKKHASFLAGRKPYVPFGVNYYRPGTGWAPQLWKKFDLEATRVDFARMKAAGVNCVRVFLTYGSFYTEPGILKEEGIRKFDQFLALAEEQGMYVHPTGPDHWEGMPAWKPVAIEDDNTLAALESFWRLLASRYRGRNVIFAYDLRNEPEVAWDSPALRRKWNKWLERKYGTSERLASAWQTNAAPAFGLFAPPPEADALLSRPLLDYQEFRECIADEWTRRQAAAIKAADPDALVTVGLIQWSVPALLPGLKHYSAFRPERQAPFLDFMEVHFYPFANGVYTYQSEAEEQANLAYLESVVREVARPGKPVVLAEFGWYGGGKPRFDGGRHPASTEEQHARYCRGVVETTAGLATGWLNWGFYDQPEASDCSQFTGLLTSSGEMKEWGRTFTELAKKYSGNRIPREQMEPRPELNWDACLTSSAAAKTFREEYLRHWRRQQE